MFRGIYWNLDESYMTREYFAKDLALYCLL